MNLLTDLAEQVLDTMERALRFTRDEVQQLSLPSGWKIGVRGELHKVRSAVERS